MWEARIGLGFAAQLREEQRPGPGRAERNRRSRPDDEDDPIDAMTDAGATAGSLRGEVPAVRRPAFRLHPAVVLSVDLFNARSSHALVTW